MAPSRVAPSQPEVIERLSVGVRRGHVSAYFYARPIGTDDVARVSPEFRAWLLPWKPRLPLEKTPQAVEALRTLEASLLAEGWESCAHEPDARWHEREYRRLVPTAP